MTKGAVTRSNSRRAILDETRPAAANATSDSEPLADLEVRLPKRPRSSSPDGQPAPKRLASFPPKATKVEHDADSPQLAPEQGIGVMPASTATPTLMGIPAELRKMILVEVAALDPDGANPLGNVAGTNRTLYAQAARFRLPVVDWKASTANSLADFTATSQTIEALPPRDRTTSAISLIARWPRQARNDRVAVVPAVGSTLKSVQDAARIPARRPAADPFYRAANALSQLGMVEAADAGFDTIAPLIIELQQPRDEGYGDSRHREQKLCAALLKVSADKRPAAFYKLLNEMAGPSSGWKHGVLRRFSPVVPTLKVEEQKMAAITLLKKAGSVSAIGTELSTMLNGLCLWELRIGPAERLEVFEEMMKLAENLTTYSRQNMDVGRHMQKTLDALAPEDRPAARATVLRLIPTAALT